MMIFIDKGEIVLMKDGRNVTTLRHGASACEECGLYGDSSEYEIRSMSDDT